MRDAAVGFHCPQCVADAARTTRSGRTAFGGVRSLNAGLTSMVLIGVNAVVWLAILATGGNGGRVLGLLAQRGLGQCQASGGYYPNIDSEQVCAVAPSGHWVAGVADGAPWELLTSMFSHVEIWHIGFNMLALWFLGPQLELIVGRVRFLALYLLSGLAGSTVVLYADPHTSTLGASGAIFGLMGALLVIAYRTGGNVQQIGTWLLLNAVLTFTVPHISWQGHLGGFVGGCAIAAVLAYAPRGPRRTAYQVGGLVLIAAVLAVAVGLRIAALG
jgi:membrane associated rhomboid family serine protease